MARLGLGNLLSAGPRAVSRYTGTLLSVFVAQSLVAGTVILATTAVLANVFSHLPSFDEAVDGDLGAIISCWRYARNIPFAIAGIVFGAIVLWQLASWFLVGGLYNVLAQRPDGRGDTARCFGAGGASTYLAYARLALCALPGWAAVLFLWGTGLGLIKTRIELALTVGDALGPFLLATLPAFLLFHVLWTVVDYARVELTLRHDTHDPGVLATYLRTQSYVLRRPLTLIHAAVGWLAFAAISAAYFYLSIGHPMYGTEGAIALFIARQSVSLLRMAIRFGVLAGQVELGRTRPLPPRRVEVKVDSKP